jgi:hypothetical protein
MARLPFRRRRTKLDTVKDLAQIYTTLKLSQAGGKAAKRAAQGYAGVKAAKGGRKIAGPALAALGVAALIGFLKRRNREPTGYEPPVSQEPATEPAPAPTEAAAPAAEPEAPSGPASTATPQPSGGGISSEPETSDLEAGSVEGRESYPLGSSVSAEDETPAGSPGAPKSASTEAGAEKA